MAKYCFPMVIEQAQGNYSAYLPDLDGCVATGHTLDEVKQHMKEAQTLHIEGMLRDGNAIPAPSIMEYVEVEAGS